MATLTFPGGYGLVEPSVAGWLNRSGYEHISFPSPNQQIKSWTAAEVYPTVYGWPNVSGVDHLSWPGGNPSYLTLRGGTAINYYWSQ